MHYGGLSSELSGPPTGRVITSITGILSGAQPPCRSLAHKDTPILYPIQIPILGDNRKCRDQTPPAIEQNVVLCNFTCRSCRRSAGCRINTWRARSSQRSDGDEDEVFSSAPDELGASRELPEDVGAAHEQEDGPALDEAASSQPHADWRHFRANLIASEHAAERASDSPRASSADDRQWAHQIVKPERGSLLVAKRKSMGIFSRSVVRSTCSVAPRA